MSDEVLRLRDVTIPPLRALVARYGLELRLVAPGEPIPGSYWGEPEAGLVGAAVVVRDDTPIHSLLHETCHALCMDPARRASLHTDALSDELEESACCYLQVVLAAALPEVGAARMIADMDRWGYSFRRGSTAAWLADDADDARRWLTVYGLLDEAGGITYRRRGESRAAIGSVLKDAALDPPLRPQPARGRSDPGSITQGGRCTIPASGFRQPSIPRR